MAVRKPLVLKNGRMQELPNGDGLNVTSTPGVVTLADASTIATNAALGNRFRVASAVDRTLGAPSNPTDGQFCTWCWENLAVGDILLTLASGAGGFRFGSMITGTTSTSPGKKDYIGAQYNGDDNRWDVLSYTKGF